MAIYRTGTASLAANGVVIGVGTKWQDKLSLIRVGATIMFPTVVGAIGTISAIVNDTELRVMTTNGAVVPAGSQYVILLHDSITVDGLAQDVAETLRYYQSKETEVSDAIEFFKTFDWEYFKTVADKVTADAAAADASKNAAAGSATAAAGSATAAKTSETNAKASETAANASKQSASASQVAAKTSETNAKTSETNAKNSENAANTSKIAAAASQAAALASQNAAKTSETNAKASETASKTSETNAKASEAAALASKNAASGSQSAAESAKAAAETAKNQAVTAKDQAQGFRNEAEEFANSADAKNKVPYAGVTVNAPTGVADMLKRLRDTVKGGFWRVDDISQFPVGEMAPFRYGPGVCGGASDTFFAINVDWQTSRVKVYSGNNVGINGTSGSVSAVELAKLGANGDVAIGDGGTGASNDQGARANLQAMHERQATLVSEDLDILKGDKAGFYYQSSTENSTPERNYPVASAGCLLVQRTGDNVATSCVQTYTTYGDGRRWMRWIDNGATGTWSQWYELYNSGSSPDYNAYVRATSGERTVEMFVGGSDVGIRNRTSQKVLQMRDNGELAYDNKMIAYDGLNYSNTFNLNIPKLAIHTANGGLQLYGTANNATQPLYVAAYQGGGTRLWYCGKDTGNSVSLLNDVTKSKVELTTDGVVLGTKDFLGNVYAQGSSFELNSSNGRHFKMLNGASSKHDASFKLWGNGSDRSTCIEFVADGLSGGWMAYMQVNSNDTKQLSVNGSVNCTTVNQSSDRELKDDIKPIENARAGLDKMGGYTYTLKKNGMPYAGVIAQEVMDVLPEAVSTFEDHEYLDGPTKDGETLVGRQRFFQVDYGAVAAYAVQVCKEQEKELVSLRSELDELKAMVLALSSK